MSQIITISVKYNVIAGFFWNRWNWNIFDLSLSYINKAHTWCKIWMCLAASDVTVLTCTSCVVYLSGLLIFVPANTRSSFLTFLIFFVSLPVLFVLFPFESVRENTSAWVFSSIEFSRALLHEFSYVQDLWGLLQSLHDNPRGLRGLFKFIPRDISTNT